LHSLNMQANEQRSAQYLGINPMGKVPALLHGETIVTEQVAIFLYLADLYPEAKLAPKIADRLRGEYLRWMVFYAGCFEPAIVDRSQQREPAPVAMCPYGDFDTMFKVLTERLAQSKYWLGDEFTALDVLWGSALSWTSEFKLTPPTPTIDAYVNRFNDRPSVKWVRAKDAELAVVRGRSR
jgi:glutathione S-transferase